MFPNDWRLYKLEQLSTKPISYGVVQTGELVEGGVACVRVVDLTSSKLDPKMMITTNQEINQAYKKTILEKGDLMIALRGEIGLVCLVDERIVGCNLTRGIARVTPKINLVDSAYLLWAMRAPMCRRDFIRRANGSALQEISISELRKIIVPIPSLSEQKKIAEILGNWDEAIALTEKAIAAKQKLKKALYKKLIPQKLGNPILGWSWKRLSDIAFINRFNIPENTSPDKEFHYVELTSVKCGFIDFPISLIKFSDAPSRARRLAKKENIVMATVRPNLQGFAYLDIDSEDLVFSTGFAILESKDYVKSKYIYQCLYSKVINNQIQARVTGSNYPAINSNDLNSIRFPIPNDIDHQVLISDLLSTIDSDIFQQGKYLNLLKNQKQGLMQKLLTGKWRVTVESDA
jgi:type I restriction enzyme, S subunit